MKVEAASQLLTETVIRGIPISPGIGIGRAHVVETGQLAVPEYTIGENDTVAEQKRFSQAVATSNRQVQRLKNKAAQLPAAAADDISLLLDAHLAMLSDSRLVRGVLNRIDTERINAEAAVQAEIQLIVQVFAQMEDSYLSARMADVREVGSRLIRNLMQRPYRAFSDLPPGTVLLAEELTPADVALIEPGRIAAIATVLGGPQGHTAIMARSLGIPAVLGVVGLMERDHSGVTVVVDGQVGRVIVNPSAQSLEELERRQQALLQDQALLKRMVRLPAVSSDGVEVALHANLEFAREVANAREAGAQGVGLFRTEFMFMNRDDLPGEEEQYQLLRSVIEGMAGRSVTARTLDVGGEKLAPWLTNAYPEPANPALSLRAIRLSLREPRLLETQLAAMLRAARLGPLRILIPMITSVSEVAHVRRALLTVHRRLKRRGVDVPAAIPPLGVMIETPGAALSADALARVADFFAIGTNDLTQYTLAIDRADEQVADLYDPLHPAVLRLIQFACGAAFRTRIPVSVCGEIAGDCRFTAILLGLGVRELSMTPFRIAAVKRRIRSIDMLQATRRAGAIMDESDPGRIAALVDDFNGIT